MQPVIRVMPTLCALWCVLLLSVAGNASAKPDFPMKPDPRFNGGQFYYDRFARPADHNFVSEHIVRLDNGDVVVAGRISLPTPLNPGGPMYLGMARYNSAGVRVAWGAGSDTDSTWFNRQYVVYPKGAGPRFLRIADIVSYGGYLYVMGDVQASVGQAPRNVQIAVFRTADGEFQGIYNAFARSEDEFGAGLVPIDANFAGSKLLAVGTRISASGVQRPTFRRFTLNYGSGALTLDTSIAPGSDGYRDVVFPNAGFCDTGACSGTAQTVAWYGGGFTPMGIYVGGTLLPNAGSTEYLIMRVDIAGAPDPSFNGVGMQRVLTVNPVTFPIAQGYLHDLAVAPRDLFNPQLDEIYGVGSGAGGYVVKLRGDGALDPQFGVPGQGYATAGIDRAFAMIIHRDNLLIAGQTRSLSAPINENHDDAVIVSVSRTEVRSATQGSSIFRTMFPARRPDATRYGNSVFYGLVEVPGGFVATGDVRDDASGGTLMFGTLGVRSPRVFSDSYE